MRSLGSSNSTIDEIIQRHKNDYEITVRALNLPVQSLERLDKLDEDLNPLRVSVKCVIILISHKYSTEIFNIFYTLFQVCWLASMTRGLTSVDEVTNCLHAQIMIDKLREDLQWRSAGRQNDDRPGMSKFFNVLAVYCVTYLVVYRYLVYWIFQYSVSFPISVVLNVYCEGRNLPKLPPLRISQLN